MVCKHFSSIPKLSMLWVDGIDKKYLLSSCDLNACHFMYVIPCRTMSHPCVTPCQVMSCHVTSCVTPCVTPCQIMSHHVTPCVTSCHLCYIFVDLTLLMCKLSWLLQELPVLYKPVFLEHLLTSEERQLQKQPILPLSGMTLTVKWFFVQLDA